MSSLGMGGEISEIDRACTELAQIEPEEATLSESVDAWIASWASLGDSLWQAGIIDEKNRLRASAARRYLRATNYYLTASMVDPFGDGDRGNAYAQALRAFDDALRLSGGQARRVVIPYGGTAMPALFVPSLKSGQRGCMIHVGGTHDTKEVTFLRHRFGLADRGISLLIVDHPGSGEAVRMHGLSARPDSEAFVAPCVDYLCSREDVDPNAIGIVGQSVGGYHAARAAAFEPRLKVCVVWGALWDAYECYAEVGESFEPSRFSFLGVASRQAVIRRLKEFTLAGGVAERIECPLLILHGENDRQRGIWNAHRLHERATRAAQRHLRIFAAGESGDEHIQVDLVSAATDYVHDWLALFFGSDVPSTSYLNGGRTCPLSKQPL